MDKFESIKCYVKLFIIVYTFLLLSNLAENEKISLHLLNSEPRRHVLVYYVNIFYYMRVYNVAYVCL